MPKILHLSDIHYGNDFIPWAAMHGRSFWKRPPREVIAGLRTEIRRIRPDYVVMSGDFVNKARAARLLEAADFLRELLLDSGVDIRNQVLIVPGNHDVSFLRRKNDLKRLRLYREFMFRLYRDVQPEQRMLKYVSRDDRHQLIFLGLDTTLKSLAPKAEGEVGRAQVDWTRGELAKLRDQMGTAFHRYVKVVILHHHVAAIAGESARSDRAMQLLDAGDLVAVLEEYRFDLVLHGHKHVPHVTPMHRGDGGNLLVVGAGTVLGPYPDQQGPYGNNFNLVTIRRGGLEAEITRYSVHGDGSFRTDGSAKAFSLGRPITEGFKSERLRRVLTIQSNGDTEVVSERRNVLVVGNNKMREIPFGFDNSNIPGAEISDFELLEPQDASITWDTPPTKERYGGSIVFSKVLTTSDEPTSIGYRYTIKRGTIMSLTEKAQRYGTTFKPYEEQALSIASDVDELIVELHFPRGYVTTPSVLFEKNGVSLDSGDFTGQFSLRHDKILNVWTFQMDVPPKRHLISVRWTLPKQWP